MVPLLLPQSSWFCALSSTVNTSRLYRRYTLNPRLEARYTEGINASCSPSSSSPLSCPVRREGFNIAQEFLLRIVRQLVPG
ncbi:hypothetical protein B0H14DRAFT_3010062 [Mycena olivaceomarginata]|nr:hypothetical protein B0H14DRAFT_3010062 [Mycena olivaceomarginata]